MHSSKKHIIIPLIIGVVIVAMTFILTNVKLHNCEKYYELISTEDATCVQDGEEIYQCRKCDETKEVVIPKIEHAYALTSSSKPTCTSDGIDIFTCSMCLSSYQNTTAAKLGHDIIIYAAVAPDCLNTGLTEGSSCTRCEFEILQEVVDALGHNMVTDEAVAPDCLNTGLTEGSHCTRCEYKISQEVVDALGHNMVTDAAVAPDCLNTGLTEGSHCTRCEHKIVQKVVDALGHNMVIVGGTPAGCLTDGLAIKECTRCDEHIEEILVKLGHNIVIDEAVTATCLSSGLTEGSHCTRCELKVPQEEIPKKPHTPSGVATLFEACVCTVCNTVLQDKLNHELGINYNYGFAADYKSTAVNTQDRSMHYLGKYYFYQENNTFDKKEFEESISLHEFYTHNLLSTADVTTSDGKHFYTDGGFKVSFEFQMLDKQLYDNGGMDIINKSDFADQFDSDAILKIVKSGKSKDGFYQIYQVVDFANSSIEISRLVDGAYITVTTISSHSEWEAIWGLKEIVFSAKDGKLFSESGTYRIMFKFNVAWFIAQSSNGKICNENGKEFYPYGFLNDQYDYFYVTVNDSVNNTLLPEDIDESKDMFYQINMDDITDGRSYIKSGESITVTDDLDFIFDHKIAHWDEEFHYQEDVLTQWSMYFFTYDKNNDEYVKKSNHDLLECLKLNTNKVRIPKQTGYCKIEVHYTLKNSTTGEELSYTDVYYLTIS